MVIVEKVTTVITELIQAQQKYNFDIVPRLKGMKQTGAHAPLGVARVSSFRFTATTGELGPKQIVVNRGFVYTQNHGKVHTFKMARIAYLLTGCSIG